MSDFTVACAAFILMGYIKKKNKKKNRRWWQANLFRLRNGSGGIQLVAELKQQEISGHYRNFLLMSSSDFEYLLTAICPKIAKQDTKFRAAITIQERLAVTLRFLATGDSYLSLQYLFKMSRHAIGFIIPEVCKSINELLKENIQLPQNSDQWLRIAEKYESSWQFPHCLGALDGKHIIIQAPLNSGSDYYNYKGFFSLVLLILVDANYKIIYANIGCQGRISDGGVFSNCMLNKKINEKSLNLSQSSPLPGRQLPIPYFFVADEAFPINENIMKVYSGFHAKGSVKRIYNYGHCRARRVVENVFGIMSSVFRVLRKPMLLCPEKVTLIVTCICHLHNCLRNSKSSTTYATQIGTAIEQTTLMPLEPARTYLGDTTPNRIRDEVAEYCSHEGKVKWQYRYA